MTSAKQMLVASEILINNKHEVTLPKHTEAYADNLIPEETSSESTKNKIEQDLIRDYFEKIKSADAILVVNVDKRGIENYIGGNAFLEMGFAHCLNKKIFIMNSVPSMIYTDEILAMQPTVLKGDLSRI